MHKTQNLQILWKNIQEKQWINSPYKSTLQTTDTNAQPVDTVMRTEQP